MTVAHDAATEALFAGPTADPVVLAHTPTGTPAGVIAFVLNVVSAADLFVSATYGGVAMTRIATASDTAGEPGFIAVYFLGAGIPTGAQNLSVDVTSTSGDKQLYVMTVTAAANTEVIVTGSVSEDATNPQVALDTGATSALRYVGIHSGTGAVGNLALLSGMSAVLSRDHGPNVSRTDRQTTDGSGSFTIGYTATIDDVAMVAAAIQEVSGAATVDPYPYVGGGYYPVEG